MVIDPDPERDVKIVLDRIYTICRAPLNTEIEIGGRKQSFSCPTDQLAAIWDIVDRTVVFRRVLDEAAGRAAVDVMQVLLRRLL